jgi:transglutaminase-like putative cysteine protease
MKRFTFVVLALAACGSNPDPTPAGTKPATAAAAPATPATPADDQAAVARLVALAKDGPDADKFPQADAYVAEERDDITLRDDGTMLEHHHSIVRLIDAQRGKDKFADVHIQFDARRQTLELKTARTITADGTVHVASAEEIGDIVPPQLADATIYSDVRERVVSFPAVDTGSVVELEYTRATKPGPDAPLGGEEMLGEWNPVAARTVTITVPATATAKLEVVGMTLAAAESSAANTRTYTFALHDLPDHHPESGSYGDAAVLPRLVYGFQPDWNHVLEPVADRFLSAAVPTPLPASVIAEAARITANAKTETERARAIFAFVAHDIRSVDLPLGWAGYQPHAPDVVLANRYGDDRDKVGLILALCAAVKLDGRPVLVRAGKVPVIAGVPTVAQFDRMIAKLAIAGKDVWLDPSDEEGQYDVAFAGQDNLVLPVARGGGELGRRPPLDPSSSISHTTTALTLSANGDLAATYQYELTGWYADEASVVFRPLQGDHQTRHFQQAASRVAADAVHKKHTVGDTMSVTGPVAITDEISVPGYAEAQGSFRVLELPPSTLQIADDVPPAALAKRTYPLAIGTPRTLVEDLTIAIPAGWKVAATPPPVDGKTDGIAYKGACETRAQLVTCHTEVVLDRLELPVDKYPAFRAAITKLRAYERRIVLLTK